MEAENANPAVKVIRNTKGLARTIAAEAGITPQAVWMWKRVPPRHAGLVARCLRMPLRQVCPEIFPAKRGRKKNNSTRD